MYIKQDIKITSPLPDGLVKIIELVEKLDALQDSEYLSYATTLKVTANYYLEKNEIDQETYKQIDQRYPSF